MYGCGEGSTASLRVEAVLKSRVYLIDRMFRIIEPTGKFRGLDAWDCPRMVTSMNSDPRIDMFRMVQDLQGCVKRLDMRD